MPPINIINLGSPRGALASSVPLSEFTRMETRQGPTPYETATEPPKIMDNLFHEMRKNEANIRREAGRRNTGDGPMGDWQTMGRQVWNGVGVQEVD
jgi:hypothetical protein